MSSTSIVVSPSLSYTKNNKCKNKKGEMRDEKSDGCCSGSGRGFRKWKASCNGVE
jgi:hypothetical protein